VVNATPRTLYPRERLGTYCIGGWVGPRAGLDGCGKSRPPTGIRSPGRPFRSVSLYRLSYPGQSYTVCCSKFRRDFVRCCSSLKSNGLSRLLKTFRNIYFVLTFMDRASLVYSFKYTNKMQSYTLFFIAVKALHVSGGLSAHHQEFKNYMQHLVYVKLASCYR
jgi:hypothetical protein